MDFMKKDKTLLLKEVFLKVLNDQLEEYSEKFLPEVSHAPIST